MACSTPGFPLLHCLPEFAQTHAHWARNAIQPSHPLLSPSPPTLSLTQHQGLLLGWVSFLHQVTKVLEPQHQSFQWIFKVDFLQDWLLWSPCCPRESQESSPAPQFEASVLRCSAFLMVQLSHPCIIIGKTIALTIHTSVSKVMSLLFNTLPSTWINDKYLS